MILPRLPRRELLLHFHKQLHEHYMQQQASNRYFELATTLHNLRGTNEYVAMSVTLIKMSNVLKELGDGLDDEVGKAANVVASDVMDVSKVVYDGTLTTEEAYIIAQARIDTFVFHVMRPYVGRKYGLYNDLSDSLGVFVGSSRFIGEA